MRSERDRELERLFHAAQALDPAARAAFLDGLPGSAAALRDELAELLAHHDALTPFLEPHADASIAEALAEGSSFGAYRIERELGRGGMGIVYLAEEEHPRRRVALKVIQPGIATPRMLRRFEQESAVLARMRHPGIAQIYAAGSVDRGAGAQPFFAMEWVQGTALLDYVHAQRLGVRERLALVLQACDALEHAHRQQVVHRDLKPSNLLVDESGAEARIKVVDFGIARVLGEGTNETALRTEAGQVLGTLLYMSPEQASGAGSLVDARSDVYALGVIAYELLAGRLPLDLVGKPLHEALRIVREDEPTPLARVEPTLRGDLDTILAKALEKDPARRYTSAAAFAADLRRYLDDRPIEARPPSRAYRLAKFTRRHRAAVVASGTILLALAIGIAATARAAFVATRERDAAQVAAARADRAAVRAAAIARFQREMLARVQPELDGREVKLAVVLDAARAELPGDLAGDPAAEGGVRKTLAESYAALGLLEEAAAELDAACRALAEGLGAGALETLQAEGARSSLLADRGRLAEAIALAETTREAFRAHHPPECADALTNEMNLAQLWTEAGRGAEGEALARQNLAARRELLLPDDPLTVGGLQALGDLLGRRGRHVEAAALLREAEERSRAHRHAEHPDALRLAAQLATVERLAGELDRAEPRFARTIDAGKRVFGPDYFELFAWQNNYAGLLEQRGRLDEAEAIYLDLLERMPRVLGPEDPGLEAVRSNLEGLRKKRPR